MDAVGSGRLDHVPRTTTSDGLGGLRALNVVVGLAHLVQGVVILLLANDFATPVTAAFLDGPPGEGAGAFEVLTDLRFAPVVALFLYLAAADHLLMATPPVRAWYEGQLRRGRNPARWIEYSVSASVMVVLIAMLTGISDIAALVAIFGANAAMILLGLMMERQDRRRLAALLAGVRRRSRAVDRDRRVPVRRRRRAHVRLRDLRVAVPALQRLRREHGAALPASRAVEGRDLQREGLHPHQPGREVGAGLAGLRQHARHLSQAVHGQH
jgi:Heliorhodopsin